MRDIYVMIKPVSGHCNMRCQYCFYTDEMAKREKGDCGTMSQETLEAIIRKSLSLVRTRCVFAYQGGEPTLAGLDFYEESIRLQKKYNLCGVEIQNVLQTNGLALDEKWCRFLAENHFLVGISLDGIKETHDKYRRTVRNEDTYFKVLETIKRLDEFGVEYNILTVVNDKTASKIERIYEKYRKSGIVYQQYIICMDPIGEGVGGADFSLTPKLYEQFLKELFRLWLIDWQKGCQPVIRQFENWIGILKGYTPEACEQRGVCGVQNIVEADGTVYPCDFYAIDGYELGNIREDSWEDIYKKREAIGFREKSKRYPEECKHCKYAHLCRNGCLRYRDVSGKNVFCSAYKGFFEQYYETMMHIAWETRLR